MSRSRKKNFWVKDKKDSKSNWYNKIFRRVNRILVRIEKDPKLMDELVNKYNVCDYKFQIEEDSKWARK